MPSNKENKGRRFSLFPRFKKKDKIEPELALDDNITEGDNDFDLDEGESAFDHFTSVASDSSDDLKGDEYIHELEREFVENHFENHFLAEEANSVQNIDSTQSDDGKIQVMADDVSPDNSPEHDQYVDGRDDKKSSPIDSAIETPVLFRADGSAMPRHTFGEYLYHKGLVSLDALEAASREQEVSGDRIGQILVANGFLTDKARIEAIIATSSERIAQENVSQSKIPTALLAEHQIGISAETEHTIYVSTMGNEEVALEIVREYYPNKIVEFVSFLPTSFNNFISRMDRASAIEDINQTKDTMLERTLYRALGEGASDIHIFPRKKSYTIMFRILGVRRIVYEGQLDEYQTIITQIKDKSSMDLAERRKPQDGGFQIEYSGKMIDLRVATVPGHEGEIVVMRVLDPDRVHPNLGQLGITDVIKWRKGFNQQNGLCLICGPTGSGKTTTLNSSIREMDRFGKSIYTIEDPVEYRIPYVTQISVNEPVGLTFARAVRACMRADPDVIVIGEVRDEDTARNAIKAADTGHLVLATLHTGSIVNAVSRLRDLGIDPRELRYLLRAVLVQTLVRTLCPTCKGSGKSADDLVCTNCNGSRYTSRCVVSECEYFEDVAAVDNIINSGTSNVVRTWPTMVEDAVSKMHEGLTDEEELRRVFGAGVEPFLRDSSEEKEEEISHPYEEPAL